MNNYIYIKKREIKKSTKYLNVWGKKKKTCENERERERECEVYVMSMIGFSQTRESSVENVKFLWRNYIITKKKLINVSNLIGREVEVQHKKKKKKWKMC